MQSDYYLIIALGAILVFILFISLIRHEKACGEARRRIPGLLGRKWVSVADLQKTLRENGIGLPSGSLHIVLRDLAKENEIACRDIVNQSGRTRRFRLPFDEAEKEILRNQADARGRDMKTAFPLNAQAFYDQLPELLKKYDGEFVAMLDEKVVDHDADYGELIWRTEEKFPDRFVFMSPVEPPSDEGLEMDTPESVGS